MRNGRPEWFVVIAAVAVLAMTVQPGGAADPEHTRRES